MDNTIQYLNTDLDLTSPEELTSLAAEFGSNGILALHVTHCDDGRWIATFEAHKQHADPESNIASSGTLPISSVVAEFRIAFPYSTCRTTPTTMPKIFAFLT